MIPLQTSTCGPRLGARHLPIRHGLGLNSAGRREQKRREDLAYRTLMQHRSELDCKRIVLTHMSADMLSHLPDLALEAAHDGLEIVL